ARGRGGEAKAGAARARGAPSRPVRAARPGAAGPSESLHALHVDLARDDVDEVVHRHAPPRLVELRARHVGEVAEIDRVALEGRRARHRHLADGPEVEALLEELVLVHEASRRLTQEPEAALHDALELHRLGRPDERDRNRGEPADRARELEIPAVLHDLEPAATPELLLDRAPERHLDPVL